MLYYILIAEENSENPDSGLPQVPGSFDQAVSHEQSAHASISDSINSMVEPVNRNIQRFSRGVFLPFIVFQLPDQVDRPFGYPHWISFQDVDSGKDTIRALEGWFDIESFLPDFINTFRLVVRYYLIGLSDPELIHPLADVRIC